MPGLFSRINKARDARLKKKTALNGLDGKLPTKPKWDDAYTRPSVDPEEVDDLLQCCVKEIKSRGLDQPLLFLPFRPTSDPSAVRTFIRNFFDVNPGMRGESLMQQLRLYEPIVLAGVIKWCWSRLPGGVVSWDAYELFKIGEYDSKLARDAFRTFIPLSVESDARQHIIFSFFELLAAMAAHGKTNGFTGRKLSRMAAWWAFEQKDTGKGFDGGYQAWIKAADATTHLFFSYLRSLSPEGGLTGIDLLPRSLQKLLDETEYPPQPTNHYATKTNKLVMVVDKVSPTPFALLRRASHFQFRESDVVLRRFSEFDDPVDALTEECHRVLKAVSAANQSHVSSLLHSSSLRDPSWSRFEDIGFSSALTEEEAAHERLPVSQSQGLRTKPASGNDLGRPTTPSWADFLNAGFVDESATTNMLLPPDQVLPPIEIDAARQRSSQSHHPRLESERNLEPGELASITPLSLDDAFWWVWMSSLAPEETVSRKSTFGRCAVIEIKMQNGQWLVLEEMVAGAAPAPDERAYIAEKKSFFSWTKRSRTISRRKSVADKSFSKKPDSKQMQDYKPNVATESQAKIHAKAVQMRAIREQQAQETATQAMRQPTEAAADETKRASEIPPQLVGAASSAMKWTSKYDKGGIKDAYMENGKVGLETAVDTSIQNGITRKPVSDNPAAPDVPEKTAATEPAINKAPPTPPKDDSEKPLPARESSLPQKKPVVSPKDMSSPPKKQPFAEEGDPIVVKAPPAPVPPPKDADIISTDAPEETTDETKGVAESDPPAASTVPDAGSASESASAAPEATSKPLATPVPVAAPAAAAAAAPPAKPLPNSQSTQTVKSKEKGGLRKLFGRKNRNSKLPESFSSDAVASLAQSDRSEPTSPAKVEPDDKPVAEIVNKPRTEAMEAPKEGDKSPSEVNTTKSEAFMNATGDEPAASVPKAEAISKRPEPETAAPVSSVSDTTTKATMGNPQFTQGPLTDQPAFVPESEDEQEETPVASKPAASTKPSSKPKEMKPEGGDDKPKNELTNTAGPGVQDRWAQIRKNAANRAAQRQTDGRSRDVQPKSADAEDDTSGEETIESRVARIKARVAELTGNMEGTAYTPPANGNKQP